jgi:UTP--glucose-1-phosphate uridylyltransferase
MHARLLEGDRHDIGDKWGYIKATLSFALQGEDLRENLLKFLFERLQSVPK